MALEEYNNEDTRATHFLQLNDDCLVEIFKYLNIHEVFSLLGCICKRIDEVIYERLALVKHLSLYLKDPPVFSIKQIEILGRSLTSLYISSGYSLYSTLTLNYLRPICYQGSLQFLTLHYVHFDENYQKCLMHVAAQLQFLGLSYCQLTDDLLGPILERADKLRTLTVFGNYNLRCESLRCLKSKKIRELKVELNSNCRHEIQKFMERNPQITMTSMADDNDDTKFLDLNDDCLIEIFKYLSIHEAFCLLGCICKRIDEIVYERLALVKYLSINLREPPVFTRKQLEILGRSLTSLYISAGYSLASTLTLNYLQPICYQRTLQFLTLHYVNFDEYFQECLIKVAAQLQFLDLSYCQLTDALLGPILEKCNKLRTLTIFGNYNLRCESLLCLKSENVKEVKVELNSNCRNYVQKFIERNPQITVTIFSIGYLGHMRSNLA